MLVSSCQKQILTRQLSSSHWFPSGAFTSNTILLTVRLPLFFCSAAAAWIDHTRSPPAALCSQWLVAALFAILHLWRRRLRMIDSRARASREHSEAAQACVLIYRQQEIYHTEVPYISIASHTLAMQCVQAVMAHEILGPEQRRYLEAYRRPAYCVALVRCALWEAWRLTSCLHGTISLENTVVLWHTCKPLSAYVFACHSKPARMPLCVCPMATGNYASSRGRQHPVQRSRKSHVSRSCASFPGNLTSECRLCLVPQPCFRFKIEQIQGSFVCGMTGLAEIVRNSYRTNRQGMQGIGIFRMNSFRSAVDLLGFVFFAHPS